MGAVNLSYVSRLPPVGDIVKQHDEEGALMRTIGMLGGMSWESTAEYYRLLNRGVAERLGGLHSARVLMHSVDFAGVAEMMRTGDWETIGVMLGEAASALERAGADVVVITSNTIHQVAPAIERAIRVPFIHIVDPIGSALATNGVRRAGLLGTRYTMELPFWRERMVSGFGVELVVPNEADRELVHRVIFDELCRGRIVPTSREAYLDVVDRLGDAGAEAVIFGCTEISLLLRPEDVRLPVYDTTALHVEAVIRFALGQLEGNGQRAQGPNDARH